MSPAARVLVGLTACIGASVLCVAAAALAAWLDRGAPGRSWGFWLVAVPGGVLLSWALALLLVELCR